MITASRTPFFFMAVGHLITIAPDFEERGGLRHKSGVNHATRDSQ
jgi:hypothetical protein